MNIQTDRTNPTAEEHAESMAEYARLGEQSARALPNRGPIRFNKAGDLDPGIVEAYRTYGFYVFERVIDEQELAELRSDVDELLFMAPAEPGGLLDRNGEKAFGSEFTRPPFRLAKPLSDPLGGTDKNKGRHPVEVTAPTPTEGSPAWTVEMLHGNLQLMDSCLRLYGHPGLLAACAAILGDDFVPYNEVVFSKEPGLGP